VLLPAHFVGPLDHCTPILGAAAGLGKKAQVAPGKAGPRRSNVHKALYLGSLDAKRDRKVFLIRTELVAKR
jgi:hypothetical protein